MRIGLSHDVTNLGYRATNARNNRTHRGSEVSKIRYSTEVELPCEQKYTHLSSYIINFSHSLFHLILNHRGSVIISTFLSSCGIFGTGSSCIYIHFQLFCVDFRSIWLLYPFYLIHRDFVPVTCGYLHTSRSTLLLLAFYQSFTTATPNFLILIILIFSIPRTSL